MEGSTATLDALRQLDLAGKLPGKVQVLNAQPGVGDELHRPIREGRVQWADLSKEGRVDTVVAMLKHDPSLTYEEIAKALGTTRAAIGGAIFRAGKTRLYSTAREVHPKAHPVVKAIFAAAYNAGLTDADLAKRSGYAMETIWVIRTATRGSKLSTLSDLAEVVGLDIVARPK